MSGYRRQLRCFGFVLACALTLCGAVHADDFATVAERSGYRLTASYNETVAYARKLDSASTWVHVDTFGISPQGRSLYYLVASKDGAFKPAAAKAANKTVVLVQNGIHAGEIAGKEACFALLRDMVINKSKAALLDNVIFVVIPIFNVDGHENNARDTRTNQEGPENAGFRVTAQLYNLNRDYLKADAPEMRAWLRLWQAWLPDFFIDDHITDGMDWQYEISYAIPWYQNDAPQIVTWSRNQFEPDVRKRVEQLGYNMFPYAYSMGRTVLSGLGTFVYPPRFSNGYTALWNRPGMLIEIHSLKDFKTRVLSNYAALVAVLENLNVTGVSLKLAIAEADSMTTAGLTKPYPLTFKSTHDSVLVDLLSYEFDTVSSPVTKGEFIHYDRSHPKTYHLPYYNGFEPDVSVIPPRAYLIPREWTEQIEHLKRQGIRLDTLVAPLTAAVERYHFDSLKWATEPYEGHFRVQYQLTTQETTLTFPSGTVVVDMHQPAAKVAIHALEPKAPDALVRWGYWQQIFERKEYIEDYTVDPLAEDMLARDPGLKTEFEAKLAEDTAFANSPRARRLFFYERSPYFETQLNWYPVVRFMGQLPTVTPMNEG